MIKKIILTLFLINLIAPGVQAAAPVYNRDLYPHWEDLDDDCQDTRSEILIKYNTGKIKFDKGDECQEVLKGKWKDPYSNKVHTKAQDLDIDHVIPLQYAHTSGAFTWNKKKRLLFANDVLNLLPVSLNLNRTKGALPPSEWMPPFKGFHCKYLTLWRQIQQKYQLKIPKAEMDFIRDGISKSCKTH